MSTSLFSLRWKSSIVRHHCRSTVVILCLVVFVLIATFTSFGFIQGQFRQMKSFSPPYRSFTRQNAVSTDEGKCLQLSETYFMGSTQAERRHILRKKCSHQRDHGIPTLSKNNIKHARVLEKYALVVSIMTKCGGTNWCRVLLSLAGIRNKTDDVAPQTVVEECHKYIPTLLDYNAIQRSSILQNFTTVIFVRNPFTRLLSAFRDRLEKYPNRGLGTRRMHNKKIYTMFGNHSADEMLDPSVKSEMYNVTFKAFVDYYLSGHMDVHWTEQYKLSQPCIDYDYIGKVETYDDDINQVLKLINADPKLYHYKSLNPTNSSADTVLASYYDTLSDEQMEKLTRVLSPDMEYFGYSIPEVIRRK